MSNNNNSLQSSWARAAARRAAEEAERARRQAPIPNFGAPATRSTLSSLASSRSLQPPPKRARIAEPVPDPSLPEWRQPAFFPMRRYNRGATAIQRAWYNMKKRVRDRQAMRQAHQLRRFFYEAGMSPGFYARMWEPKDDEGRFGMRHTEALKFMRRMDNQFRARRGEALLPAYTGDRYNLRDLSPFEKDHEDFILDLPPGIERRHWPQPPPGPA